MNFDYGPMRIQELNAIHGDVGGLKTDDKVVDNDKGRVFDLVFPVVVLIITCIIGMIYVGGYFGVDAWGDTGCAGDFIAAFGNTDAFIALPWGALIALVVTIIYMLIRRVITFKDAMGCVPKGFNAMIAPIIILTLAVSLNSMTGMLGAKVFVHDIMAGASGSLYSLLPAVIFLVACLLAFASGTSWGTFGILIPIVTAVFPSDSTLLIIGISACLAGAVCGDHCSPISDTTIMASAGGQCDHVVHVSTQLPYAITVAVVSFVSFILAGFIQNAIVCLIIGALLIVGVLFVMKKREAAKA
jgi:Na+/H+ antiporter NhaC